MIKITVVTVCYNSEKTIAFTLKSVADQTHDLLEHLIIDAGSADRTLEIIAIDGKHVTQIISEPDNGIYDAMNKGLSLSTGDVVGFLNSDDCYSDKSVIAEVAAHFADPQIDYVYGDIKMINSDGLIVRHWKTGSITTDRISNSQIPHPAFFVRRSILNSLAPPFDTSYRISADLKQQLIITSKLGARGLYINRPLVHMSIGGASTRNLHSYYTGWIESARAYNDVFGRGGWWYTFKKVIIKVKGMRKINLFNTK